MVIEAIIIITAVFSLVSAVFGFDMPIARDLIAIVYIIYGLFHFPYQKIDRYDRPGLGTGCVIIVLSGLLSFFFRSWWFLPFVFLGFLVTSIVNARYERTFY